MHQANAAKPTWSERQTLWRQLGRRPLTLCISNTLEDVSTHVRCVMHMRSSPKVIVVRPSWQAAARLKAWKRQVLVEAQRVGEPYFREDADLKVRRELARSKARAVGSIGLS